MTILITQCMKLCLFLVIAINFAFFLVGLLNLMVEYRTGANVREHKFIRINSTTINVETDTEAATGSPISPHFFWTRSRSRRVEDYLPTNFSARILPSGFCSNSRAAVSEGNQTRVLLVIVYSSPCGFESRENIRRTWGNWSLVNPLVDLNRVQVSIYFLVGELPDDIDQSVQEGLEYESYKYNDIIQNPFVDNYYNLSLKSVSLLKLLQELCMDSVDYVIKVDRDVYVNFDVILPLFLRKPISFFSGGNLLLGNRIIRGIRHKDPYNRYYAPSYMFPASRYPTFLSGPAYLMSIDVTKSLWNAALHTPIFHLEDVYITGICAQKIRLRRSHSKWFFAFEGRRAICEYLQAYTIHMETQARFKPYFRMLPDLREYCELRGTKGAAQNIPTCNSED